MQATTTTFQLFTPDESTQVMEQMYYKTIDYALINVFTEPEDIGKDSHTVAIWKRKTR